MSNGSGKRATMRAWVDEYLDVGIQSAEPATRRAPRPVLIPFAAWWDATRKHPRRVTSDDLIRFFLKEAPFVGKIEAATFNHYWTQFRRFLRWCMATKRLPTDLSLLEAVTRKRTHRRDFTRIDAVDLSQMVDGCDNPRDRCLLATSAQSLARQSELKYIKVGNVDLRNGELLCWSKKRSRWTRKFITPALDTELRRYLRWYLSGELEIAFHGEPVDTDEWFLFPRRAGRLGGFTYWPDLPIGDVRTLVLRYTEPVMGRVKWEGATHTLRRSGAQAIMDAAENPDQGRAAAQYQLDHEHPETTDLYTGSSTIKRIAKAMLRDDFLPDVGSVRRIGETGGASEAM